MSDRALTISSVQQDHDHVQLVLRGVLDPVGIALLSRRLHGLVEGGARFVVVDLTEVSGSDPHVLAVLSAAVRRLSIQQGWLRVVGIQPQVAAALDTADLPDRFTMHIAAEPVA